MTLSQHFTAAYAKTVAGIILLARKVPLRLSTLLERLALSLVSLSRHLPPMPRTKLTLGVPFIGEGVCVALDCKRTWRLFIPTGGDEEIELECPVCEQSSGVVA